MSFVVKTRTRRAPRNARVLLLVCAIATLPACSAKHYPRPVLWPPELRKSDSVPTCPGGVLLLTEPPRCGRGSYMLIDGTTQ